MLNFGSEIKIIDITFACTVVCMIDTINTQEIIGVDESAYMAIGRTKIKFMLDRLSVHY